ncbi:MAG: LamG-like jellyroll fold domain-containing protein [Pseudomonadota bacterium]
MAMVLSVPAKAEIQRLMNKDALIAHYTFDKDVNDITGNVEPIDGLALKEVLKGKHGGALRFDGKAPLEIPIDLSADILPEFTVSMWVKADRPPTDEETRKALSTSMVIASNLLSISNWKSDTPSFYAGVPGARVSNSQHRVRPGQWTHVVITRKVEDRPNSKGETVPHIVTRLFSGGRMTESIGPYNEHKHAPSIYLGGSSAKGSVNNFVGLIDDLKIYKAAADEAQIGLLKASELTTKRPGQNTDDPTSKATKQIEQTVRGDEIMGDGIGNKGSEDDVDIPFEGPIRDNPIGSGQSPVEALKDAARKNTSSISLPTESLPDPIGLPTGDVSAENTGTPPLLPGGFGKSPKSIDTPPSDQPVTGADNSDLDPSSIGMQGPVAGQVGQLPPPVDDADAIRKATAKTDWKITALKLYAGSEEKNLFSGRRVKLGVTIARHDLNDKLAAATLSVVAAPTNGGPPSVQQIALRQSGDGVRKTYPIVLDIPSAGVNGKPLGKTNIVVTAKINFSAGDVNTDEAPGNNVTQASFVINDSSTIAGGNSGASPAECEGGARENADGARTSQKCLTNTFKDLKEPSKENSGDDNFEVYFDNDLLVYTDLPYTKRYENATVQNLVASKPLRNFQWHEAADKPCYMNTTGGKIDLCDGGKGLDWSHWIRLDPPEVITGIRVCRNAANRRFKGVSFEVREIDERGGLSTDSRIIHEEKTNCVERTQWGYCRGGSVARGVRLRIADGTWLAPRKFVHSVDLICSMPKIVKN